ncbi:MAG: hypothetical protein ACXADY_20810 [Candidatus Hodarchaeales archaeon]|jgi:hypothetical protein
MPRKSLTGEGTSQKIYFRTSDKVENVLKDVSNRSEYIRNAIIGYQFEHIDTQILKKLIVVYARTGINIDLESQEIMRVQQLAKEVL